jgi:hypothetical protein
MKTKPKMDLIFGNLITAAGQVWAACWIERIGRLERPADFSEQSDLVFSSTMGRSV